MGRKIRRGLPLINHAILIDNRLLDERDRKAKLDGKRREDIRRWAQSCCVQPGDIVIVQRQSRSKGQSRFSPTRYTVTDEYNGNLVLNDGSNQFIKRYITQTKKVSQWQQHQKSADDEHQDFKNTKTDDTAPNNATETLHYNRKSDREKKPPAYLDQFVRRMEQ